MKTIRKPYFWAGMSFAQKAAYLCSSAQARDYSEACSILARQPRTRKAVPTREPVVMRYPYNND